jgi:hypothetical protein
MTEKEKILQRKLKKVLNNQEKIKKQIKKLSELAGIK